MVCSCKGFCENYKDILKTPGGVGSAKKSYRHGWKRCARCGYNIKTENLRCECCHGLFKTTSQGRKRYEKKLLSSA